jgi:hypothetical protein
VRAPPREAEGLEQAVDPLALGLLARDRERQDDVLLGAQHREEVEELEDETVPQGFASLALQLRIRASD